MHRSSNKPPFREEPAEIRNPRPSSRKVLSRFSELSRRRLDSGNGMSFAHVGSRRIRVGIPDHGRRQFDTRLAFQRFAMFSRVADSCSFSKIDHDNLIAVAEPILHYELRCKGCGEPLLFPVEPIERLFVDRDAGPNNSHAIAIVCRLCKRVAVYFLDRTHPGHDPLDLVRFAVRASDTVRGPMLECDESKCNSLLPLFAQWSSGTGADEKRTDIATWQWNHLFCPLGHSIAKPDLDSLVDPSGNRRF